jgi:succinoglycan biosynthesis transport protein ExoP
MNTVHHPRETTARDFLSVLFRRKLAILVVVLVATLLTVGRSLHSPVMYTSTCQVLIQGTQRTSLLEPRTVVRPPEEVVNAEMNIAKSDMVIDRAKAMLAERRSRPSIFWLKYASASAEDAQQVVAALAEAYLGYHRELNRLPDARVLVENALVDIRRQIDSVSVERRDFLADEGHYAGDKEKEELGTSLQWSESQLLNLETEIAGQSTRVRAMRRALASGGPEAVPLVAGSETASSPSRLALQRMSEDLTHLRAERSRLLARYQEGHREVKVVDEAIATTQAALARGVRAQIDEEEAALAVLRARRDALARGVADLRTRLARIPELEHRLQDYDRRLTALGEYYRDYQHGEYSLTLAEETGRDFDAVLLSPASRPHGGNPRDAVRLALGPALGLLAGVGLALFLERLDRSVHTAEDVETALDLPVLTSVSDRPWRPPNGDRFPWSRKSP